MLNKRRTTYILLAFNLALVLFVVVRSGSDEVTASDQSFPKLTIEKLARPLVYPGDTLLLLDFEKKRDIYNMYHQGGEYQLSLGKEYATHGVMALVIQKQFESNMELAVTHFPQDWRGYDSLFLDIYNDDTETATLWLRIGDRFDATRFYIESQKFTTSFKLEPGANRLAVAVDDIFEAFGYPLKRMSLHFNFPANSGERLILDNMRLVRYDG